MSTIQAIEEKLVAGICVHDDHLFLKTLVEQLCLRMPVLVFVSRVAWDGSFGPWELSVEAAKAAGAEVITGEWACEAAHRGYALDEMKRRGYKYVLLPDSDEIPDRKLLDTLTNLASIDAADVVNVRTQTYWKSTRYVVVPREEAAPIIMVNCQHVQYVETREFQGELCLLLTPEHGLLHRLAYVGSRERILRNVAVLGLGDEVAREWCRRKWLQWDSDPLIRDLHPINPPMFSHAQLVDVPEELRAYGYDQGDAAMPSPPLISTTTVSVVVALGSAFEEVHDCLVGLVRCRDMIQDVLVVGKMDPDQEADIITSFASGLPGLTTIRLEGSAGFASSCNAGFRHSIGDYVLFLRAGAIVTRAGLVRLIETLLSSVTVGASGPMSNLSGHYQQALGAYQSERQLESFAVSFAHRNETDREVEMLVGLCLFVKRTAIDEIGGLPFDERFGSGIYVENDLCYRLARAGFRLLISSRAFVHFGGSKSTAVRAERQPVLLHKHRVQFEQKWGEDLQTGFASHLPGQPGGLIRFQRDRDPQLIRDRARVVAHTVGISICMIVKNEERVLGSCLETVVDVFPQVVVVDTGSTDRTREIATSLGAEVYEFPWSDSFSEARNESLRHARGSWIFWIDADDTVPLSSIDTIVSAAERAPAMISGFVVPVQFIDDGRSGGTRVDHVKLFRNDPSVRFEGRIHEQILPSLIKLGGEVARLDAVVLHSGYDTSPAGQEFKRRRDKYLLKLDLDERPGHTFVLFNMGMTAHYLGEHEDAVTWLSKSIRTAEARESHVRKAFSLLANSQRSLGQMEDAADTIERALATVGYDPELLFTKAMLLSSMGLFKEAIAAYLLISQELPAWFSSFDIGILTYKRSHNLGTLYYELGDYASARKWWLEATVQNPKFLISAEALFDAAERNADAEGMQFAQLAVARAADLSELWFTMEIRRLVSDGRIREAALEMVSLKFGTAPGLQIILARELLDRGDISKAEPILQELASAGNAEATYYLGVQANRKNDLASAFLYMIQAWALNPVHKSSAEQVAILGRELSTLPVTASDTDREEMLGPYAGELGVGLLTTSVIVVTYNAELTIGPCTTSVLTALSADDELIIVDNNSGDRTDEVVRGLAKADSRIVCKILEKHVGYARAANLGILSSRGRNIVLLSAGTEPQGRWLEHLIAHQSGICGAIGPLTDNGADLQTVSLHLPNHIEISSQATSYDLSAMRAKQSVIASALREFCVLVSRQVFNRVGLFDECIRQGSEYLELSWRLRLFGLPLMVALDAYVAQQSTITKPPVTGDNLEESDETLVEKLKSYYGVSTMPSLEAILGKAIVGRRSNA